MRIHFVGERDDGICPTSQWGRALRGREVAVSFDEAPGLSWRSADWRRTCRSVEAIHLITYSQRDQMLLRRVWWARMCGCTVVRSWIGSDVLWALHHEPSKQFALNLLELGVRQLAVADHLIDELSGIGIRAEYVPIVTPQLVTEGPLPALPQVLTVLGYLPARRRTFYGGLVLDQLIQRRPEYRFIIVGDEPERYRVFTNVEVFPSVDNSRSLIERSSVLVRPTLHDGMPRMMLEALALGRHVITPWRYPHCAQATHVDAYLQSLDHLSAVNTPNESGSQFVRREFNPQETVMAFSRKLLTSSNGLATSKPMARRFQAIRYAVEHPGMWDRSILPAPSADTLPKHAIALQAALAG